MMLDIKMLSMPFRISLRAVIEENSVIIYDELKAFYAKFTRQKKR